MVVMAAYGGSERHRDAPKTERVVVTRSPTDSTVYTDVTSWWNDDGRVIMYHADGTKSVVLTGSVRGED